MTALLRRIEDAVRRLDPGGTSSLFDTLFKGEHPVTRDAADSISAEIEDKLWSAALAALEAEATPEIIVMALRVAEILARARCRACSSLSSLPGRDGTLRPDVVSRICSTIQANLSSGPVVASGARTLQVNVRTFPAVHRGGADGSRVLRVRGRLRLMRRKPLCCNAGFGTSSRGSAVCPYRPLRVACRPWLGASPAGVSTTARRRTRWGRLEPSPSSSRSSRKPAAPRPTRPAAPTHSGASPRRSRASPRRTPQLSEGFYIVAYPQGRARALPVRPALHLPEQRPERVAALCHGRVGHRRGLHRSRARRRRGMRGPRPARLGPPVRARRPGGRHRCDAVRVPPKQPANGIRAHALLSHTIHAVLFADEEILFAVDLLIESVECWSRPSEQMSAAVWCLNRLLSLTVCALL